jgi:hypothetical protein
MFLPVLPCLGRQSRPKGTAKLERKQLRLSATRLTAFALKALEDEDGDFAKRQLARASECLDMSEQ